MRAFADQRTRGIVVVTAALTIAAIALPRSAPSAPTVQSIDLCAKAGTTTLPGGASVPIWGFALKPDGVACSAATVVATTPGPQLTVGAGDTVTLRVTNALPGGRTISLEAPGVDFDAGPTDAGPGDTVSRTFTAVPGTYLYASSGGGGRQQAMGLAGALVVRSSTAGQAYDSAASAFDAEQTLVLSEIDPALNGNANPDTYNMLQWHPTYWLINGKAHPDTATVDARAGQRLLLRYVNAGLEHVTMTMLGLDTRLVARDAYALDSPFSVVAETFAAGATADGIVAIPSTASAGDRFAVYDRQLHLTNGAIGDPAHAPGGMLTFVRIVP
jgi:FtsP/CotA-like multicopper oxidase with cupredoxin domain